MSMINSGKAATTGSNAGVTKKIQGIVKIWERPDAYVTDTPGIMIPYFGKDDAAAERAMSLALSGASSQPEYAICSQLTTVIGQAESRTASSAWRPSANISCGASTTASSALARIQTTFVRLDLMRSKKKNTHTHN